MSTRNEIYKGFKSEAEIKDYFSNKVVHCVGCKGNLTGSEPMDFSLHNTLAISIEKADGEGVSSVPRIVCTCGYKNTILKLLYQTT
jgi:hypothetical protein